MSDEDASESAATYLYGGALGVAQMPDNYTSTGCDVLVVCDSRRRGWDRFLLLIGPGIDRKRARTQCPKCGRGATITLRGKACTPGQSGGL